MKIKNKYQQIQEIWQLTWPQASMLLCQFFISITDVWAAGQLGSEVQASIGIIAQTQMLLLSIVMAASSGAVASISQSLGAKKYIRAQRYIGLVVFICLILGVCLTILGVIFQVPFLEFVQTPESIFSIALMFFEVYLLALPGQYMLTIGSAVFRAVKSVYIPLYVAIIIGILNFIGDMAFGLGWWGCHAYGAIGIAWTTCISVSFGGVVILFLLFYNHWLTRYSFPPWCWIKKGSMYLLQVAGPSLATAAIWQTGYLVLFIIAGTLPSEGVATLAGLTAGIRIEAILFLPGIAFSMTSAILVGYALGLGNKQEAKHTLLMVVFVACLSMSFLGAMLWPWRDTLAAFLSSDPLVRQEIVSYLSYNILCVPFTIASIVLAGGLNGAGASIYPMIIFGFSIWGIRLPLAWFLSHFLWATSSGVYMALLVSQVVQSMLLLWIVLRYNWARFSMHNSMSNSS